MKSVQWLQKVGCLKKRAINLWSFTSCTFFCLRAPCRANPLMGALPSSPSLFVCAWSAILNTEVLKLVVCQLKKSDWRLMDGTLELHSSLFTSARCRELCLPSPRKCVRHRNIREWESESSATRRQPDMWWWKLLPPHYHLFGEHQSGCSLYVLSTEVQYLRISHKLSAKQSHLY